MSNLVMIKGVVKYSHITRHTTEEELVRSQLARKSKYKDNPHSYVALENVSIIPSDASGQLTPAELFVQQNELYTKASTPGVFYYTAKNASKNALASVFVRDTNGQYQPVENNRELRGGVEVAIQLRQYEAYGKQHITMDNIFVGSEGDFYSGASSVANDFLAQAGFNVTGPAIVTKVPSAESAPAPAQTQPVQPAYQAPVPPVPAPATNYNAPLPGTQAPITGNFIPQQQPVVPPVAPTPQMPTVDPLLSGEGINSGITYQ